jgi:hypothetical protein
MIHSVCRTCFGCRARADLARLTEFNENITEPTKTTKQAVPTTSQTSHMTREPVPNIPMSNIVNPLSLPPPLIKRDFLQHDERELYSFKPTPIAIPNFNDMTKRRISENNTIEQTTVAVCSGLTSVKMDITISSVEGLFADALYFQVFLPTFCATATSGYLYHMYLAYDDNDPYYNLKENRLLLLQAFMIKEQELCLPRSILTRFHFIRVDHHNRPSSAHNDAMLEAYFDGNDYVYLAVDDLELGAGNWTKGFITKLDSYKPPKVGVVGNKHKGQDVAVISFHFLHKTHFNIFGYVYPRVFRGKVLPKCIYWFVCLTWKLTPLW